MECKSEAKLTIAKVHGSTNIVFRVTMEEELVAELTFTLDQAKETMETLKTVINDAKAVVTEELLKKARGLAGKDFGPKFTVGNSVVYGGRVHKIEGRDGCFLILKDLGDELGETTRVHIGEVRR